jgi:hypothetical protein
MLYAAFETFGWRVCPTDKEGFLLAVNLGDDADTTGAVYGQLAGAYRAEAEQLVSQNVIPHKKYFGGSFPYAFTEQGVAMLSSVLNSDRAIKANIEIMRAFVRLRQILSSNRELAKRLDELDISGLWQGGRDGLVKRNLGVV